MTPVEHYVEAERLVAEVVEFEVDPLRSLDTPTGQWIPIYVALAQVHATLATAILPLPQPEPTILGKTLAQWADWAPQLTPQKRDLNITVILFAMRSPMSGRVQHRMCVEVLRILGYVGPEIDELVIPL